MKFEDLYSLFKQYQANDVELLSLSSIKNKVKSDKNKIAELTNKQQDIEFKLLLPYKLFDLIISASNENVDVSYCYEDVEGYRNPEIRFRYYRLQL